MNQIMNTYQIFIKTDKGWKYYSKTPLAQQALLVKTKLEEQGYIVRLRKNGVWTDSENHMTTLCEFSL